MDEVDLTRYMGKWFQLMSIPNFFQPTGACNVTAEYKLEDFESTEKQYVIVHNEQTLPSSAYNRQAITGAGAIVQSGQLSVSFWGPLASLAQQKRHEEQSTVDDNNSTTFVPRFRDYLFGPSWLEALAQRFLRNPQQSNYIVYAVDSEYRWALVGSRNRKYGWVLSRTQQVDCSVWKIIYAQMKAHHFDINLFRPTSHVCLNNQDKEDSDNE